MDREEEFIELEDLIKHINFKLPTDEKSRNIILKKLVKNSKVLREVVILN